MQFYTEARRENARLEDGRLIIEARREPWQRNEYTSARLVTKGKADWIHGRLEIRARLPLGRGTRPAIWMLPAVWNLGNGQWPDNGEIDIREHVGHDAGLVHASTHSQKTVAEQQSAHRHDQGARQRHGFTHLRPGMGRGGEEGKLVDFLALEGTHHKLLPRAEEVLQQTGFSPALDHGKPVQSSVGGHDVVLRS